MLLSCHPDKSKFSWQRNNHERKKSIQKITRDKKGGEKWNAELSPEEIEKRRIITMVQWIMIIVISGDDGGSSVGIFWQKSTETWRERTSWAEAAKQVSAALCCSSARSHSSNLLILDAGNEGDDGDDGHNDGDWWDNMLLIFDLNCILVMWLMWGPYFTI